MQCPATSKIWQNHPMTFLAQCSIAAGTLVAVFPDFVDARLLPPSHHFSRVAFTVPQTNFRSKRSTPPSTKPLPLPYRERKVVLLFDPQTFRKKRYDLEKLIRLRAGLIAPHPGPCSRFVFGGMAPLNGKGARLQLRASHPPDSTSSSAFKPN